MASKSLRLLLALVLLVFAPRPPASSAADLTQLLDNIAQGKGGASLQDTMQCMQKLLPCKPYIKASPSTPPPPACCDPLKDIVTSDADCLCHFSDDASLLNSLNVTKDDALKLPQACAFDADVSKCHQGSGSSSNSSSSAVTNNDGDATANEEAPKTPASGSTKNTKMLHFGVVVAMAAFMIFPLVSV